MTSVAPLWANQQDNLSSVPYEQRKPEETLLYQLIEQYYPELKTTMEDQGRPLPMYVQEEFDAYLKCGRLEHGFLRVQCESCHQEILLPYSCKRRGFCPSCCGMRMVESAAHLVDKVLPHQPMRQWVLSFPYPLRLLLAREPKILSDVLGIVYGKVRYELKTAYRDGTTHVIFSPLDFIARLASLVPPPRVNLTRFHGVFAPNSWYRRLIIPKQDEKGRAIGADKGHTQNESERRSKMSWAQRLKRVFNIEITVCEHCGGKVKIIACIEDQAIIDKILAHVRKKGREEVGNQCEARAPPKFDLLSNLE